MIVLRLLKAAKCEYHSECACSDNNIVANLSRTSPLPSLRVAVNAPGICTMIHSFTYIVLLDLGTNLSSGTTATITSPYSRWISICNPLANVLKLPLPRAFNNNIPLISSVLQLRQHILLSLQSRAGKTIFLGPNGAVGGRSPVGSRKLSFQKSGCLSATSKAFEITCSRISDIRILVLIRHGTVPNSKLSLNVIVMLSSPGFEKARSAGRGGLSSLVDSVG